MPGAGDLEWVGDRTGIQQYLRRPVLCYSPDILPRPFNGCEVLIFQPLGYSGDLAALRRPVLSI